MTIFLNYSRVTLSDALCRGLTLPTSFDRVESGNLAVHTNTVRVYACTTDRQAEALRISLPK